MEQALLTAAEVSVCYRSGRGQTQALAQFDLALRSGEFVSILGPSGCGKSTLIKLFSGLLAPTTGQIRLGGVPVTQPRGDVGIVFQQPTLLPWKTVLDNVRVPLRAQGKDGERGRRKAMALLELVGLGKFAAHYPHELSGGMQQRVSIARSLVHDPSLLLMDEPFSALDTMTRDHMAVELQRIWMQTRQSAVFITHSIPEAVFLSDRIIVMSARPGRVVREVSVDLPRPRTPQTFSDPAFHAYCSQLRDLFADIVRFD